MWQWLMDMLSRVPETFWLLVAVLVVGRMAWIMWVHYIQQDFISGIDHVLLEIIPPRDVLRSPRAMELFFTNALYHWSNKGGLEAYWQGAVWFWYSLEIVSIEGQVHFYIYTPTRIRELIETQMYAQYPQAQVRAVDDYTLAVDKITPDSEWQMWACEFKLENHHAYPIKTYIDYGLDKDPKEEFKIDPISPVIELFGSLKKGEQMWLQIVVRPSKNEFHSHTGKKVGWVDASKEELERLLEEYAKMNVIEGEEKLARTRPPFAMEPTVKGITDKMLKIGFDTGIRAVYVAKKEAWSMNSRRNIRLIFRQYSKPLSNSFERTNSAQADALGGMFPGWFMLKPETVMVLNDRMLHEYRERAFFYHPMRHQLFHHLPWPISPYIMPAYFHPHTFVLNVEELATIWHFPGQILKVPTLERIESKEASPPNNLPT
jgi:hypothetical protein